MRVAVVGAGLAGLAAACELGDRGHDVTVFERRPWAGGKTYSFVDEATGASVDNGQHVFMRCTTEYERFLRRLGTLHLARRQRRLRVPVFDGRGRRSDLYAQRLPPPLHLGRSFARYRHLAVADKVRIGRLLLAVHRMSEDERRALAGQPFGEWLRLRGQTGPAIRDFWDFIVLPTLNCRSAEASTADALFVLREGFLASPKSAAIGVPAVGLSELHVDPAVRAIEARGGEVRTRAEVRCLAVEEGRFRAVQLAGGSAEPFDACVLAVPHTRVAGLVPPEWAARAPFAALADIPTAPIVNLHFWFDRPALDVPFAAFVGSELQWAFDRDRLDRRPRGDGHHLVLSLSGAREAMGLEKRELEACYLAELRRVVPAARAATVVRFAAIKEPEATFVPAPGIARPGPETPVQQLVLAGAYTDTGWPATMESAVRSGIAAARQVDAVDPAGGRGEPHG